MPPAINAVPRAKGTFPYTKNIRFIREQQRMNLAAIDRHGAAISLTKIALGYPVAIPLVD